MASEQVPVDPLQLAYAVAALQSESSVMKLLASVPQSLEEEQPLKLAHNHAQEENSTKQTPGSGSTESCHASTSRTLTPDLSQANENDDDTNKQRLAKSRERNREHARRTRLRKKAHLEGLQSKVKGLEAERQVLKQNLEECGVASILLGLSAGDHEIANSVEIDDSNKNDGASHMVALLATGKRKRFLSEAMPDNYTVQAPPLTLDIDGEATTIGGGKSHINWKTGVYRDEEGNQKQLTSEQLENLRRERNRMHAKMTRDRKKCFIATIEKTIEDLENENNRMRSLLSKLAASKFSQLVTPVSSPKLTSSQGPHIPDEEAAYSPAAADSVDKEKPPKRVCHGFSLDT